MQVPALSGKVAVVTGSSRGIGAAIVRLFAAHGARVVVHGREASATETVRKEIAARGATAISVLADVTKFAELESVRRRVEAELGAIDILVANAGGNLAMPGPVEETAEEAWRATIDANLTATFLTIKSFLP